MHTHTHSENVTLLSLSENSHDVRTPLFSWVGTLRYCWLSSRTPIWISYWRNPHWYIQCTFDISTGSVHNCAIPIDTVDILFHERTWANGPKANRFQLFIVWLQNERLLVGLPRKLFTLFSFFFFFFLFFFCIVPLNKTLFLTFCVLVHCTCTERERERERQRQRQRQREREWGNYLARQKSYLSILDHPLMSS